MSYKILLDKLRVIYWSPPLDVAPSTADDFKKVAEAVKKLIISEDRKSLNRKSDSFDEWFDAQGYSEDDGCYQEKYLAAKDAWEAQMERIQDVTSRLEKYPTCASCYVTIEESTAASKLKVRMMEILREGLL